ncbi:hypothetical protein [Streptomyces sp. NPDC048527]|uniref:hypothetical protein n=1 Tax=Streptomyces sp. NPDC048527 TaxID=3365568 RepID=UPI00371F23D4
MTDFPQLPEFIEPTAVPEGKQALVGLMEDYVKFKITEEVLSTITKASPSLSVGEILSGLRVEADRAMTEIIKNAKIADDSAP